MTLEKIQDAGSEYACTMSELVTEIGTVHSGTSQAVPWNSSALPHLAISCTSGRGAQGHRILPPWFAFLLDIHILNNTATRSTSPLVKQIRNIDTGSGDLPTNRTGPSG